jgi:hypothetical protein
MTLQSCTRLDTGEREQTGRRLTIIQLIYNEGAKLKDSSNWNGMEGTEVKEQEIL